MAGVLIYRVRKMKIVEKGVRMTLQHQLKYLQRL